MTPLDSSCETDCVARNYLFGSLNTDYCLDSVPIWDKGIVCCCGNVELPTSTTLPPTTGCPKRGICQGGFRCNLQTDQSLQWEEDIRCQPIHAEVCGNGYCGLGESEANCPADCTRKPERNLLVGVLILIGAGLFALIFSNNKEEKKDE